MNSLLPKYAGTKSYTPWMSTNCVWGYSFDSRNGTTIYDVTGNYPITTGGTIVAGKVKQGHDGGIGVYMTNAIMSNRHSFNMWFKVPDFNIDRQLYFASAAYQGVQLLSDKRLKFEIYQSGFYTYYTSALNLQSNVWYMFTKAMQPDGWKLLGINGVEVWRGSTPGGVNNGNGMSIAGSGGMQIDNVVFLSTRDYTWNAELTLYNSGKGVKF